MRGSLENLSPFVSIICWQVPARDGAECGVPVSAADESAGSGLVAVTVVRPPHVVTRSVALLHFILELLHFNIDTATMARNLWI